MDITWNDIIEILKMMFNFNQKKIADTLNVSKFVITRLAKGQTLKPSFTNEDIYNKF